MAKIKGLTPSLVLLWFCICYFEAQKVTWSALKLLDKDDLAELIPELGPRKIALSSLHTQPNDGPLSSIPKESASTSRDDIDSSSVEVVESGGNSEASATALPTPSGVNDEVSRKRKASVLQEVQVIANIEIIDDRSGALTVENILKSTPSGQSVISYFNHYKSFTGAYRKYLTWAIIDYEIGKEPDKRISSGRFLLLAQGIAARFTTEKAEAYYSQAKKLPTGKVVSACGKLWERYTSVRDGFRKSKLLPKRSKRDKTGTFIFREASELSPADQKEMKDWCSKNTFAPKGTFISSWVHSQKPRLEDLFDVKKAISAEVYVQEYPALKRDFGHTLIYEDFNYLHEKKGNCLFDVWPTLKITILNLLLEEDEPYVKLLSKNGRELLSKPNPADEDVLFHYSYLFPQSQRVTDYKPSRYEIATSFILRLPELSNLEEELVKRKDKLKRYNIPETPIPVIITGDNPRYLVDFDSHQYTFKSTIEAFDFCFKVFLAVNIRFSPECCPQWLLFQKYIYRIETDYDSSIPTAASVATLLGL